MDPENKFIISVDVERDFLEEDRDLEPHIERLLEIFEHHGIRATFFIVADFWCRRTRIIERIAQTHEIASHSLTHTKNPSSRQVHHEINDSKQMLEDSSGHEVIGFRAPFFLSHDERVQRLIKAGYRYDASTLKGPSSRGYRIVHETASGRPFFEFLTDRFFNLPLPLSSLYLRVFHPVFHITNASSLIIHPHDYLDGLPSLKEWLHHPAGWWTLPFRHLYARNIERGYELLDRALAGITKPCVPYRALLEEQPSTGS